MLILDACNSGAFIGKGAWDAQLRNSFQSADYQVLTSAGARENSFLWRDRDGVGGGSYFAQELCEGLRSRVRSRPGRYCRAAHRRDHAG